MCFSSIIHSFGYRTIDRKKRSLRPIPISLRDQSLFLWMKRTGALWVLTTSTLDFFRWREKAYSFIRKSLLDDSRHGQLAPLLKTAHGIKRRAFHGWMRQVGSPLSEDLSDYGRKRWNREALFGKERNGSLKVNYTETIKNELNGFTELCCTVLGRHLGSVRDTWTTTIIITPVSKACP